MFWIKNLDRSRAAAVLALVTMFLWMGQSSSGQSASGQSASDQSPAMSAANPEDGELGPMTAEELRDIELLDAPTSEWIDPPEGKRDADGVYNLTVAMATNKIAMNGKEYPVELRAYNGGLVGPTIRFKAGDELKIRMKNDLPEESDPSCRENPHRHGNTPACFNLTNLHTHGLHVSPRAPADDVSLIIQPKGEFLYRYPILPRGNSGGERAMHYPGTFWYHAHRHGSTAIQLAGGMAGALILEGDIDEFPGVKEADERIFVFQQLAWDAKGRIEKFDDILPNWAGRNPENGPPKQTTINGRVNPVIRLEHGQVERWRWIDAGVFEMLDMQLIPRECFGRPECPAVPLHQIAIDGITLKEVTRRDVVRMGPGYRTDLLVRPPSPGVYVLVKRRSAFKLAAGDLDSPNVDNAQVLAVVDVSRERCIGCPALLPPGTKLPFPGAMLPDITRVDNPRNPRKAIFGAIREQGKPPVFLVNGKQYEHGVIDHKVRLGGVEEWLLGNEDPNRAQAHPFHIHVNAFQMQGKNGEPAEWRDTVVVPAGANLRMRTRYERFDGDFVLHCHILTHEDMGMMEAVRIVKGADSEAAENGRNPEEVSDETP